MTNIPELKQNMIERGNSDAHSGFNIWYSIHGTASSGRWSSDWMVVVGELRVVEVSESRLEAELVDIFAILQRRDAT